MLRSIQETRKLFTIEGVTNGQVDIKATKHLLSLKEEKQIEVLEAHLKSLKADLLRISSPAFRKEKVQIDEIDRMQLQLLVQVIEGLLKRI